MKNFSNNKARTLVKEAGENVPFIGIKDLFPDPEKRVFKKGDIPVYGFIKVNSKTYKDKVNYSLLIEYKGEEYFLNVPSWYGAELEEDFTNEAQPAAEYFKDAFIEKIEEFETKYKNNTYNIIVFED